MFEREALETREFTRGKAAFARKVIIDGAAAADGVSERTVGGVRAPVEPGTEQRGVVWKIAGDAGDGVADGAEKGKR